MKKILTALMVMGLLLGNTSTSYASLSMNAEKKASSKGLIVKLQDSRDIEGFLQENNLTNTDVKKGRNGYLLIKTDKLTENHKLKKMGLSNVKQIKGVEKVEENAQSQIWEVTPNDPFFATQQWNLKNIGMTTAWEDTTGQSDVVVAVIDTGLKIDHQDLTGKQWVNNDEIPNNGKDDDGNGYADDVNGYDFTNNNNLPNDDYGHGTAVASVITANTNDNIGLAGMNWQAKIMPLKVCDANGWCMNWDIAEAIYYAADNGAKVINLSLGGYYDNTYEREAVEYAQSKGVTIVAASGNNGYEVTYPAKYDQVIAVGSVDKNDKISYFSNGGPEVDLVAPGEDVYMAFIENTQSYIKWSGTSFASPHVAGTAALLYAFKPNLTNNEIRSYLQNSVSKVDGMNGANFDYQYGYGRLNVPGALTLIKQDNGVKTIEGKHEAEQLYHQVGRVTTDLTASAGKSVQVSISDGAGYLQYGPYVGQDVTGKRYMAKFSLKSNNISTEDTIIKIEISNTQNGADWKYLDIRGVDFNAADVWEDFYLVFDKNNIGSLEYRIFTTGLADIATDFTEVTLNEKDLKADWQSENLYRNIGTPVTDIDASEKMAVQVRHDQIGYAQFGPYTTDKTAWNNYQAMFRIKASDNTGNENLFRIEVNNHQHPAMSAERVISAKDFALVNQYEDFGLDFKCENNDMLEYRVYALGNSSIDFSLDSIKINENKSLNITNYEAENMPSQTGRVTVNTYYSGTKAKYAIPGEDTPGFLTYGPYSNQQLENNNYYAKFRLKTDNNAITSPIAMIEVYNPGGSATWIRKDITGQMFTNNDVWQDFTLHFGRGEGGVMEYRIYFYGTAKLMADNIQIIDKSSNSIFYEAEDMNLGLGKVIADNYNQTIAVKAEASQGAGFVVYGPYTTDQKPGKYLVRFVIKSEGVADGNLARIDVVNNEGVGAYTYRDLTSEDFYGDGYNYEYLNFDRTTGGNLEFRVYSYGKTNISVDKIYVERSE